MIVFHSGVRLWTNGRNSRVLLGVLLVHGYQGLLCLLAPLILLVHLGLLCLLVVPKPFLNTS